VLLTSAVILALFIATQASAQEYFDDPTVQVARHDKRKSNVKLPRGSDSAPLEYWGLLFEQPWAERIDRHKTSLVHYEKLPNCEKSDVRLEQIYQYSTLTDVFDVVYYSEADPGQVRRAKKLNTPSVAYQAALVRDEETGLTDTLQTYARFLQIRCLPTRFRYVDIGSKRYREFRTGAAVWEE
jgi:hypothetical protein